MFSGLLFGKSKKTLKGFKVTSVDRSKKYGIAADSLIMLKEKASEKFKVSLLFVNCNGICTNLFARTHILDQKLQNLSSKRWHRSI